MLHKSLFLPVSEKTNLQTSLHSLRWAMYSPKLRALLKQPAQATSVALLQCPQFSSYFWPTQRNLPIVNFIPHHIVAHEQWLLSTYLQLAFHFFESLTQAQFALFFKTQVGFNPANVARRSPLRQPSSKSALIGRRATNSFRTTQNHVTVYWAKIAATELSARYNDFLPWLPVSQLLQYTDSLKRVGSTQTLLSLSKPPKSGTSKLAAAAKSLRPRTGSISYPTTLGLRQALVSLPGLAHSRKTSPAIAPTTVFLEHEAKLYKTGFLLKEDMTPELKLLYPGIRPARRALSRLQRLIKFRQPPHNHPTTPSRPNEFEFPGFPTYSAALRANRYWFAVNAAFKQQACIKKITLGLPELQFLVRRKTQAARKLLGKPVALHVPTNIQIFKMLQNIAKRKNKLKVSVTNRNSQIALDQPKNVKLSWPQPQNSGLLSWTLRLAVNNRILSKHVQKINKRFGTVNKDSQSRALSGHLLRSKASLQIGLTSLLVQRPKTQQEIDLEYKEMLALRKVAYLKHIAFLKTQGEVKYGQLVKKTPKTTPLQPKRLGKLALAATVKPTKFTPTRLRLALDARKQGLSLLVPNALQLSERKQHNTKWVTALSATETPENAQLASKNPNNWKARQPAKAVKLTKRRLRVPTHAKLNAAASAPKRVSGLRKFGSTNTTQPFNPFSPLSEKTPLQRLANSQNWLAANKMFLTSKAGFATYLESVLGLLGRLVNTATKVYLSKFVKVSRPEITMFSPRELSIRKRRPRQNFSGLALKQVSKWSAGSPKRVLASFKGLRTNIATHGTRGAAKQHHPTQSKPASRHLLGAALAKCVQSSQGATNLIAQPHFSSGNPLSTASSLSLTVKKYEVSISSKLRTIDPTLLLWTLWNRGRVQRNKAQISGAAKHRRRYRPKRSQPWIAKALFFHTGNSLSHVNVLPGISATSKQLSKKQRQILRNISSRQILQTFFPNKHKAVNFKKPWLFDTAFPLYTNWKAKTATAITARRRPRTLPTPASMKRLLTKPTAVNAARPYIIANPPRATGLHKRRAWTPQMLSFFTFASRTAKLSKNNRVWEKYCGFRILNRFWPQNKNPRSKTFLKAKHATLRQNFRLMVRTSAVLRLNLKTGVRTSAPLIKSMSAATRRAVLHQAETKRIKPPANPVQRLSTTRTYDMFKRFIFTFWRAQALFKAKFTPQKHWNRWKFKHKFWAWFKKQQAVRQAYVRNQIAFPTMWLVFVQLKWAITKAHAEKLLQFHFFVHNGQPLTSLEAPLAVGDIVQGPLGSGLMQKARIKELKTTKNYIKKYKRVQYLIKRSQWRKRRAKQKDVYTNFVHSVSNCVPSWLQMDLFSNSFAVITAPLQYSQLGAEPLQGYTLQKLTPWRLKI